MEFRSSRRLFFQFIISFNFRISWKVTSHTLMSVLTRMMFLVSERIFFFFTKVISSYHISRSKCLALVKRLRDDDRHDLLILVWTKIIDWNHHHWSVLVIQIFISSIYLTEDWHRNYRWGPYSDLQIVWSGHQKKVTFCVNSGHQLW